MLQYCSRLLESSIWESTQVTNAMMLAKARIPKVAPLAFASAFSVMIPFW